MNDKKNQILLQLDHIAKHWLLTYDTQVIDQVVELWEQLETHMANIVAFDLPSNAPFDHSMQGIENQKLAFDQDAIDCSDHQALATIHCRENNWIKHRHEIKNS